MRLRPPDEVLAKRAEEQAPIDLASLANDEQRNAVRRLVHFRSAFGSMQRMMDTPAASMTAKQLQMAAGVVAAMRRSLVEYAGMVARAERDRDPDVSDRIEVALLERQRILLTVNGGDPKELESAWQRDVARLEEGRFVVDEKQIRWGPELAGRPRSWRLPREVRTRRRQLVDELNANGRELRSLVEVAERNENATFVLDASKAFIKKLDPELRQLERFAAWSREVTAEHEARGKVECRDEPVRRGGLRLPTLRPAAPRDPAAAAATRRKPSALRPQPLAEER